MVRKYYCIALFWLFWPLFVICLMRRNPKLEIAINRDWNAFAFSHWYLSPHKFKSGNINVCNLGYVHHARWTLSNENLSAKNEEMTGHARESFNIDWCAVWYNGSVVQIWKQCGPNIKVIWPNNGKMWLYLALHFYCSLVAIYLLKERMYVIYRKIYIYIYIYIFIPLYVWHGYMS